MDFLGVDLYLCDKGIATGSLHHLGELLGGLDLFSPKLQDISVMIGSDCQVQLEIFFTSVHLKIAGLSVSQTLRAV